jgi:hypothetical protein
MVIKEKEKETAINLRKQGKTYSEILSVVPVAKSTLAIWLQSINLSKKQKQRITKEKLASSQRGGDAKRKQRIEKQNSLVLKAKSEIKNISDRELFLIGTIMYWAEGAKEKEYYPGSQLQFSNMDPKMIQVFLVWLIKVCKIDKNMIIFNIFLHQTHRDRIEEIRAFWSKITGFPIDSLSTVYWKRNKLKTNRKNTGEKYYGVLKIKVRKSSDLVRKIAGWSEGIFEKVIEK